MSSRVSLDRNEFVDIAIGSRLAVVVAFGLALFIGVVGCSDDNVQGITSEDGGSMDGGADVEGDVSGPVEGVEYEAEVITDSYGMNHIYARSLEDLFYLNGLKYAEDRFAQMAFFRRVATGELAEIAGGVSDRAIQQDVLMRTLGLKRSAEKYWEENYDPTEDSFVAVEAFCRGVNEYIERRKAGEVQESATVQTFLPPEATRPWEPSDVMAVGRLLALQLTYAADVEITLTDLRGDLVDAYGSSATGQANQRRQGLLHDVFRFEPPSSSTHIDGFPESGSALVDGRAPVPKDETIDGPLSLHDALREGPLGPGSGIGAGQWGTTGSNNWVLSGDRTESGDVTVANDPHLGLALPSIFYPIHLKLLDDPEGRETFEVLGGALLGIPGVVVGRTNDVAWGTTVGFYDYVDVYREEVTGGRDDEEPATVTFEGEEVPVERTTESIGVGTFGNVTETIDLTVETVPHHGPILPTVENGQVQPRDSGEALSVKWVGTKASNDYKFLLNLYRAETPSDVEEALDYYRVGSSNFVFGFPDGDIFYSGQSEIPVRDDGAFGFDPAPADEGGNPNGNAPTFVLPGQGSAEWTGAVPESSIPHAKNPDRGFVITANNDHVGTVQDNDPYDDRFYLGSLYANGFRGGRIEELVRNPEQVGDGDQLLSLEEQSAIQNESKEMVAERVVPHMVDALETVLDDSIPDSEAPDLGALRDQIDGRESVLQELLTLLRDWDYEAPGTRSPTGEQVDQSAATALFNMSMVYLTRRVLGDELGQIGWFSGGSFDGPYGNQLLTRALIFLLERPEEAATYDESIGDSWVFDDMETETTETRLTPLVMALLDAKDRFASDEPLAMHFDREIPSPNSGDPADWVWGEMHGLRLEGTLPQTQNSNYSRPKTGLPFYPRPGGEFAVSPCNHGFDDTDFTCTGGSSLRMVHRMSDDGESVTYNAVPGGYSGVPGTDTYMSEFQRWQNANPRKLETDPNALRDDARQVETYPMAE